MLLSDFKNTISSGKSYYILYKSFRYLWGEHFDPPKAALIQGYPITSLCNPFIFMGEHFQKLSNPLISFVIHEHIFMWKGENLICEKSVCADIKAGYLWTCQDIEWILNGYATGYRVDMKGYRLDMWNNLTQDRRLRAQGPSHCHCCYLDLNLCPRENQHVIVCPQRSCHVGL